MPDFPAGQVFADLRNWDFYSIGVSGAPQTQYLYRCSLLKPFWPKLDNIRPILDGITASAHIVAGCRMELRVMGRSGAFHYLGEWTAAAHEETSISFNSLNLPLWENAPNDSYYFIVNGTFAGADTCIISGWGHYDIPMLISEPAPVSVQEFHLFRPRKVTGPV